VQDEFYCRRSGVNCRTLRSPFTVAGSTSGMRSYVRCWCEDPEGCSYPSGDQVRDPVTGQRYHHLITQQRVESALVARGAGLPRATCEEMFPSPSCSIISQASNARCQWQNNQVAKLRREWARLASLDRAATQVTVDLIRTASARRAKRYAEVHAEELRHGTGSLLRDTTTLVMGVPLAQSRTTISALVGIVGWRRRAVYLQNGALLGGAALLAWVLWRRRK